jgi:hypothetical protein
VEYFNISLLPQMWFLEIDSMNQKQIIQKEIREKIRREPYLKKVVDRTVEAVEKQMERKDSYSN